MHWTCGLYKGEDTPDDCLFFCDNCRLTRGKALAAELTVPSAADLSVDALSTSLQASAKPTHAGQLLMVDRLGNTLTAFSILHRRAGVPAQGAVPPRRAVRTCNHPSRIECGDGYQVRATTRSRAGLAQPCQ